MSPCAGGQTGRLLVHRPRPASALPPPPELLCPAEVMTQLDGLSPGGSRCFWVVDRFSPRCERRRYPSPVPPSTSVTAPLRKRTADCTGTRTDKARVRYLHALPGIQINYRDIYIVQASDSSLTILILMFMIDPAVFNTTHHLYTNNIEIKQTHKHN